jgi:Amt family ammonium transporter
MHPQFQFRVNPRLSPSRFVFALFFAILAAAAGAEEVPTLSSDSISTQEQLEAAVASTLALEDPKVPAPAIDTALSRRVADLEAYIQNGLAEGSLAGTPGPGHNGFMMICAALVLFMTLPGLALFYGGMVRSKNVLSVLAQCLGCAGLVTVLWWAFGYSWAFSSGTPFLGGLKYAFLEGVGATPNGDYGAWTSQSVFAMFQLMFAIITPALMVGAIAERMKFSAIMLFIFGWMLVVYFPLAHMVWGVDGFMNGVWNPAAGIKSIDFAGGTVVHMSSGWSALVLCLLLGRRKGFGSKPFPPHSLVLTMIGTGMLWVGGEGL